MKELFRGNKYIDELVSSFSGGKYNSLEELPYEEEGEFAFYILEYIDTDDEDEDVPSMLLKANYKLEEEATWTEELKEKYQNELKYLKQAEVVHGPDKLNQIAQEFSNGKHESWTDIPPYQIKTVVRYCRRVIGEIDKGEYTRKLAERDGQIVIDFDTNEVIDKKEKE